MGVKQGTSVTISAFALADQRPRLAALLGGASNEWALLEHELASMLELLVSIPMLTDEARSPDPLSNELFDSFVLIDHRLSLLKAAFRARVQDDDLERELHEHIFRRIRQASSQRARLVHATWAVSDDAGYEDKIIKTNPHRMDFTKDEPFGEPELIEAIGFINLVHKEAGHFFVRARSFLSANRGARF